MSGGSSRRTFFLHDWHMTERSADARPLDGIKVVEVAQWAFVPASGGILSDMGAAGALNRRIEIATRDTNDRGQEARSVVEDDFHHFRVIVRAHDGHVTGISSEALRNPNSLCPAAGNRLSELIGMKLNAASSAVMEITDPSQQCTHQFDLAGLAVAALSARRVHRVYEAAIPDRVDGQTIATLRRDGAEVLRWDVSGMTIVGPAPYVDRSLGSGFGRFVRSLALEEAEAALVLRRALFISQGRGVDFSKLGRSGPVGGCWAWQPERMGELERLPASRRDFTGRAEVLAGEDQDWLRFE